MRKVTACLAFLAALFILVVAQVGPSSAQATRTWVSGVGDDVNPCSRTAPCKTFAGAISKTAAGGEISVLDPGGFGAVTITKAISITNDKTGEAGILASGTNGIVINAGVNDVVQIRGLIIDGGTPAVPGLNGIRFLAGKALIVSNVVIKNFTGAAPNGFGIQFNPAAGGQLVVTNTIIAKNGVGTTGGAIQVKPGATGSTRVVIDNVKIVNNISGVTGDGSTASVGGGIVIYVRDSLVATNNLAGLATVVPVGGQGTNMIVDRTGFFNNGTALQADGTQTTMFVTNSTIMVNNTGLATLNGATIRSFQTNNLFNNSVDGSFTPPIVAQQ